MRWRSSFGRLEHGGIELALAAQDFGFLHLDLVLLFHLLDGDFLGLHLLLHDVGLDLVSLVGLRLLLLDHLQVLGLLHFEVALGFGLLGLGKRFGQHPLLVGLGLGDGGLARGHRAPDGRVALGFGGGHVGVPLDARNVRPAHVGDVLVLVADLFDGEGNHFQAHLVHVVRAGGAHAVADHLGLLDDLFHRELADDAAQVAFHDQADEALALLGRLGEELLGGGEDGLGVGLHLDLRHRFHRDRHALAGVEILLGRDVERHQFQRQSSAVLHHRKDHRAAAFDHARAAESVNDDGFMRPGFAEQLGEQGHQEEDRQHHEAGDDKCWAFHKTSFSLGRESPRPSNQLLGSISPMSSSHGRT